MLDILIFSGYILTADDSHRIACALTICWGKAFVQTAFRSGLCQRAMTQKLAKALCTMNLVVIWFGGANMFPCLLNARQSPLTGCSGVWAGHRDHHMIEATISWMVHRGLLPTDISHLHNSEVIAQLICQLFLENYSNFALMQSCFAIPMEQPFHLDSLPISGGRYWCLNYVPLVIDSSGHDHPLHRGEYCKYNCTKNL